MPIAGLRALAWLALSLALAAGTAWADDDLLEGFEERPVEQGQAAPAKKAQDDLLEGLGDESPAAADEPSAEAPVERRWWRLSGAVTQSLAVNYAHQAPSPGQTDWRGLSRFRTELDLALDLELPRRWKAKIAGRGFYDWVYPIRGRDKFTTETLDEYEWEAEPREVYLQGELFSDLDLKLGRQIVVWGKADNVRVVDILNPLDLREPGLVDIEDLRLPVAMVKADYYFGDWALTGIVIPEIRFNKLPAFGHEFYPYTSRLPEEETPSLGLDNLEYALALSGVFSGWDLSLHAAYVFDDLAHLESVTGPTGQTSLVRRHSRLTMLGAAANVAIGNWLLKGETAWLHGFEFFAAPNERFSRVDFMAGVEYSGFTDTTISIEWVWRHLFDFDERLKVGMDSAEKDDFQTALRLTRSFRNDTVQLTALISVAGLSGQGGGFARLNLDYDLADAWVLSVGVIDYIYGEETSWNAYGDNDRVYASLEYSF